MARGNVSFGRTRSDCVLFTKEHLVGGLLMEEFPKWIITCLCSEVSWHSWIPQEPGLSTGEVYRIKFELFEDSCSFDSFIYLPLWKSSRTKAALRLAMLRKQAKFCRPHKTSISFLNTRIPLKLPSIRIWPWKSMWNAGADRMCVPSLCCPLQCIYWPSS